MKQSVNARQKVCTSRYNKGKDEYYYPIYTSTVEDWDSSDLSREALFMLLHLTTGIKEGIEWTVYQSQVNGNVFPDAETFKNAFDELERKGYAKLEDGILLVRNDRRWSWNKPMAKEEKFEYETETDRDFANFGSRRW